MQNELRLLIDAKFILKERASFKMSFIRSWIRRSKKYISSILGQRARDFPVSSWRNPFIIYHFRYAP